MKNIIDIILEKRGINSFERDAFLNPDYDNQHDPFLLPDMRKAVDRLVLAYEKQEKITIYGDYDVDGVTSVSLLLDVFKKFGFKNIDFFIPDRFLDGYGMNLRAVKEIKARGTDLILTVDCGSLNHLEIDLANSLGMEVIVTDHHNIAEIQPNAIAVVNPRRKENNYPNAEKFAGVGVAFKLAQAMSYKLSGLEEGQEKWLLDLVALGTVCDIVPMQGENRQNVFWGLKVLEQTRRPGIKALLSLTKSEKISTTTLGFVLGPRINAAGRLEKATVALDLMTEEDNFLAYDKAQKLDDLNSKRKKMQEKAFEIAKEKVKKYENDKVLVIADENFNEGTMGIVASKLLESCKKPVFVISVSGGEAKGSARSFGDFSASKAVEYARNVIEKGGGHDAAAGVTLAAENIEKFRKLVNEYYESLNLKNQYKFLLPQIDVEVNSLNDLDLTLFEEVQKLEPFGPGNEEPNFQAKNLKIIDRRDLGANKNHIKYKFSDGKNSMQMIKFNANEDFMFETGEFVDVIFALGLNEWRGAKTVEGRIMFLQKNE